MGVSTNAILAYGVPIPEYSEVFPKELNGEDIDPEQWQKYGHDDFVDDPNCKIIQHCCDSDPMFMAVISSTTKTAYRGYPMILKGEDLVPPDGADEMLRKYCEDLKIEFSNPGWYLMSFWDGY